MTDKQIIIDGVDVHWCEHYTGNIGYLTDKNWTCRAKIQGTKCEDWSNCYFKRWQRKEQECDMWKNLTVDNGAVALKYQQQIDQLKEQLEAYKMEADEGKEINAELKAENKILKEKFEIAIKNNMDKTLLRLEKGDVQEELQEIREQFGIETLYCHADNTRVHRCLDVLRLKDTLTEIKEIGKKSMREGKMLSGGWLYQFIEQKISEVEDDNICN